MATGACVTHMRFQGDFDSCLTSTRYTETMTFFTKVKPEETLSSPKHRHAPTQTHSADVI